MPKEPRVSKLRPTPYGRPATKPAGLWSRIKSFFSSAPAPTELGPPQLVSNGRPLSNEDAELPSRLNAFKAEYESSGVLEFPSNLGGDLERAEQQAWTPNLSDISTSTRTLSPNEALEQFFAEKGDAELSNLEVMGALSLIGQAVGRNESLIDLSNLGELSSHLTSASQESTGTDQASFDASSSVLRGVEAPSPRSYLQGTPPRSVRPASSRISLSKNHRSSLLRSQQSPWGSTHPYARPVNAFSASMGIQTPRKPVFSTSGRVTKPVAPASSSDSAAVQAIKRAIASPEPKSELVNRRSRYIRSSSGVANPEANGEPVAKPAPVVRSEARPESVVKPIVQPEVDSSTPESQKETLKETQKEAQSEAQNKPEAQAHNNSQDKPQSKPQNEPTKPFVFVPPKPAEAKAVSTTQSSPKLFGSLATTSSSAKAPIVSVPETAKSTNISNSVAAPPSQTNVLDDNEFAFVIPAAHAPLNMTPAEEAIVAESQTEFRF